MNRWFGNIGIGILTVMLFSCPVRGGEEQDAARADVGSAVDSREDGTWPEDARILSVSGDGILLLAEDTDRSSYFLFNREKERRTDLTYDRDWYEDIPGDSDILLMAGDGQLDEAAIDWSADGKMLAFAYRLEGDALEDATDTGEETALPAETDSAERQEEETAREEAESKVLLMLGNAESGKMRAIASFSEDSPEGEAEIRSIRFSEDGGCLLYVVETVDGYGLLSYDTARRIAEKVWTAETSEERKAYREAEQMEDEGEYMKAFTAFSRLRGYQDSTDRAQNAFNMAKYVQAEKMLADGYEEDAARIFNELGDFKDSAGRAEELQARHGAVAVSSPAKEDEVSGNTADSSDGRPDLPVADGMPSVPTPQAASLPAASQADPALPASSAPVPVSADSQAGQEDVSGILEYRRDDENTSTLSGLERYTGLEILSVKGSFSDLAPIAGLTNLRELYIGESNVGDLSLIAGLYNLTRLDVWKTNVSDISVLEGLTKLNYLSVSYTNVTTLKPLMNLPLEELSINGLRLPRSEYDEFRALHPNCKINEYDNVVIY